MPSLEIVCVGQPEPTVFEDMPFRIAAENKLLSQRTPPLSFQADFDALNSCIYHLIKQLKSGCSSQQHDS